MDETIRSTDDIIRMLDSLLQDPGEQWDGFYADRRKPIPFFVNAPDENLVQWMESGMLRPGCVLELGCGPGRNAIYLAGHGCRVDAADASRAAIDWAGERAAEQGTDVNFICCSIFDLAIAPGSYDIVYDSGCFHHVPPHRRMSFVGLVSAALKPGGLFGLTCFGGGEMGGQEISDWEVYRRWSMGGGLAYTKERLVSVFADFEVLDFRRMKQIAQPAPVFGRDFCWVALFRRR